MGILNFLKKKKGDGENGGNGNNGSDVKKDDDKTKKDDDKKKKAGGLPGIGDMLNMVDTSKLSTMQKMGLAVFKRLPAAKQEEMLRQALNPKEVQKHKKEIEAQLEELVKSGQIDKSQIAAVKSKMGLR